MSGIVGTVFGYLFGFAVLAYLLVIAAAMAKRKTRRYAKPKRRR